MLAKLTVVEHNEDTNRRKQEHHWVINVDILSATPESLDRYHFKDF